MILFLICHAA